MLHNACRVLEQPPRMRDARPVIGLLGGSFNPAHAGHVHISLWALKTLRMREIWWLVSPGNPLKAPQSLAAYRQRLQSARAMTRTSPRIRVSDIESRMRCRYTIDSLKMLARRFPRNRFVWLMGADNLEHFHEWKQWVEIMWLMPVMVFDRAPYSHSSLKSKAALRFARFRAPQKRLGQLASARRPEWGYAHLPRTPESATHLRKTLGKRAFLMHNQGV